MLMSVSMFTNNQLFHTSYESHSLHICKNFYNEVFKVKFETVNPLHIQLDLL